MTAELKKHHLGSTLPTPAELPDADVVIFDGNCRFCLGQVERLYRWDGGKRLSFLSLHSPEAQKYCPNLTHDQLMDQMYVVQPSGAQHGGALAIRYLSRRLPKLWWLAPFVHIPGSLPIWSWLYRQVASRRYQIAGRMSDCEEGACKVH